MACCAIFKPQRILELGMGLYSTPLFLNPNVCPSLKLLHSIEDDPAWLEQVRSANMSDERWRPEICDGSVAAYVQRLDISAYDLIFIDDSGRVARSHTIQAVYAGRPRCPVVIHDAEVWRLRARIWFRRPLVIFDTFNPQTAVCLPRHAAQLAVLRNSRRTWRYLAAAGQSAVNLAEWESVGRRAMLRFSSNLDTGAGKHASKGRLFS
ncbi:MAG: hypothetical protein ABSF54_29570 [Bryobacteraceae bacterium]|jgi:hypothetical protein